MSNSSVDRRANLIPSFVIWRERKDLKLFNTPGILQERDYEKGLDFLLRNRYYCLYGYLSHCMQRDRFVDLIRRKYKTFEEFINDHQSFLLPHEFETKLNSRTIQRMEEELDKSFDLFIQQANAK